MAKRRLSLPPTWKVSRGVKARQKGAPWLALSVNCPLLPPAPKRDHVSRGGGQGGREEEAGGGRRGRKKRERAAHAAALALWSRGERRSRAGLGRRRVRWGDRRITHIQIDMAWLMKRGLSPSLCVRVRERSRKRLLSLLARDWLFLLCYIRKATVWGRRMAPSTALGFGSWKREGGARERKVAA